MSSQALPGIEPLHHHDGRPEPLHRHRVDERRGVVQRRRREVHRAGADAEHADPLARPARAPPTDHRTACRAAACARPSGAPSCPTSTASPGPRARRRAGRRRRRRARRRSARSRADRPPRTRAPACATGRAPATTSAIAADATNATAPQSSSTYCTSAGRRWLLIAVKYSPDRWAAHVTSRNGRLFSIRSRCGRRPTMPRARSARANRLERSSSSA